MTYQVPTITKYVNELTPHPDNYNTHPKGQISQLAESLTTFGQFKNMVAWTCPENMTTPDGIELHEGVCYILAGHGLWLAAMEAGIDELEVKDYSGLSYEMALSLLMVDNAAPLGSEPIADKLAALLDRTRHLTADKPGLAGMLEQLRMRAGVNGNGKTPPEPEIPTETEADKLARQYGVKVGQVWQLGRHKIACVDSTDETAVRDLIGENRVGMVWADPPYGISAVSKEGASATTLQPYAFGGVNGTGKLIAKNIYAPVVGDESTKTAKEAFAVCEKFDALQTWWGANNYPEVLPPSTGWIVWDKDTNGNLADCELAWTNRNGAVRMFRHTWNGMVKSSEQGQRRVHPTQKPVALPEWCFSNYGHPEEMIFDPFLGSGISILAAEKLNDGRRVIGCELAPEYIAVTIFRWQQLTQQQPRLVSG